MFLEILQNSQENTWACNFVKKETLAQVFSCEFCEISQSTFVTEHFWTTASEVASLYSEWRSYKLAFKFYSIPILCHRITFQRLISNKYEINTSVILSLFRKKFALLLLLPKVYVNGLLLLKLMTGESIFDCR